MSILCIFFIWPLPYWHRCINSTVNSNHGVTVLQGAASCPCCCRRKAGAVEGGGDLTDVMQHPDVQGCTALFLWLNTQKKPFKMRKGRPIPNVPENPSLVTVSHSASGALLSAPREAQFDLVPARSSFQPDTEIPISDQSFPVKCTELCKGCLR